MKTTLNALIVLWVFLGGLHWILRSGIGPMSVDLTAGNTHIKSLLTIYWWPILGGLIVLRVIIGVASKKGLPRR